MLIRNQYKIISELGSGGMGVVYRGVDVLPEKEVAIKKLRTDFSRTPEVAKRFLQEAKIQARLNHPNIAQLYTCFQEGDDFYIVMELVSGSSLNKLIPVPYQRLLPLAVQILDGLDYAHKMGVLHRDIKPDNLMVTESGLVKIMDFGIAHVLGSTRMTRDKVIMGTLEYISPERIIGKTPERSSDVYSLGAVLFEVLTGRLPFEADTEFELLRKHLEATRRKVREFVPDCPEGLEAAIDRALEKEPGDRYATCAEMRDALAAEVAKLPAVPARQATPVQGIDWSPKQRRQTAETLRKIAALYQSADRREAVSLAIKSLEENPRITAFQIAALCCMSGRLG